MEQVLNKLKSYTIFYRWQTAVLLAAFFIFRLFSFATFKEPTLQGVAAAIVIIIFIALYFKNPKWSFYLLLGELLLAGSGHYAQIFGISIRSSLLILFILLIFFDKLEKISSYIKENLNKKILIIIAVVFTVIGLATINGLIQGHGINAIRDAIPFAYLILIWPIAHLFQKIEDSEGFIRLIIVFIIGTSIFSLITLFLFSSGLVELQEPFYKWFRDINLGKITPKGDGFFRIVEPSHLLLTPIILIISSLLMREEKHHYMWWTLLTLTFITFVLNFSRSYILALAIGYIVLLYKHNWKRWLKVISISIGKAVAIFVILHLLASAGTSTGLGLLEYRVSSIAEPETEKSAATRMMILPGIQKKITERPLFGHGLGSKVTFTNTRNYTKKTTAEYDWGYFEMIAEFGILGTMILLGAILALMYKLFNKIQKLQDYQDLHIGLLAGLVALGVINLTSPALFHLYGILYIVFVTVITLKSQSAFDKMITSIYRIFHKKN